MGRKLFGFFSLFIVLTIVNLSVAANLIYAHQKTQTTQDILDEIDHITDSSVPIDEFAQSTAPFVLHDQTIEATFSTGDARLVNLKAFFRRYNSPLYDHAQFILDTSDKYQLDYRILPAIAMQESGLCRVIPHHSYNCWGWGIYGSTITRFSSYEEGIDTVARGLKKNYIDKGLVTATAIMAKYTPSSNGSWARGVNIFLHQIENSVAPQQ